MIARQEPDQALDFVIAKLRAAVPAAAVPEKSRGFKVQLLHVPKGGKP